MEVFSEYGSDATEKPVAKNSRIDHTLIVPGEEQVLRSKGGSMKKLEGKTLPVQYERRRTD